MKDNLLDDKIAAFLNENIGRNCKAQQLAGDASSRRYYRITCGGSSWVLCCDENFKDCNPEDYPFIKIQRLLKKHAVSVPEVFTFNTASGVILIEDLGDDLLEYHIRDRTHDEIFLLYRDAIDEMVKIQSIMKEDNGVPFSLMFDTEKLMYEFDFFIEHTLRRHFHVEGDLGIGKLREHFINICGRLHKPEYFVPCHRDFHSRNIIVSGNMLYLIDYQDARMGLPQYDLASLLRDSYVEIGEDTTMRLYYYYYSHSCENNIHAMQYDEFDYYYDLVSFQRNIKAAGSFAYLSGEKRMPRFAQYIMPVLRIVGSYADMRPEISGAWKIIKELIDY